MKNNTKVIALDIGDVCISVHLDKAFKALGISDRSEVPIAFMKNSALLEIGRISNEDWLKSFMDSTGRRFSKKELIDIWNLIIGPSLPGMADAVRDLCGKGYRFVYFSNTSEIHMDYFLKHNDFCHLITGAVFSYESHAAKPDAGMYEDFEQRYGLPFAYFDDRPENIEAGKKRGWNSILFQSPTQFHELLNGRS